jgi:hypothetical protein
MFSHPSPGRLKRYTRTALPTILLAGLLSSLLPLETLATGQMCNLACCANRASHAAGSCMDGSCHATLSKRAAHSHGATNRSVERLCGLSSAVRRYLSLPVTGTTPQKPSQEPRKLAASAINRPCQPECGGCAAGFASLNRNHAITARGQSQWASFDANLANTYSSPLRTLTAARHQGVPRAPPITSF